MATSRIWNGQGLPSGALTTVSAGPGDNPFDTVTAGNDVVAGDPTRIQQTQPSGTAAYFEWSETTRAAWGIRGYYTTPESWPTASFSILSLFPTTAVRFDLGGSGSPGQIRIRNSSAQLAASATNVLATGTTYMVRARVSLGSGGAAQIEFWTADGATLVASLNATGTFNATASFVRFGNVLSSPTVATSYWSRMTTVDTYDFPAPYTPPVTPGTVLTSRVAAPVAGATQVKVETSNTTDAVLHVSTSPSLTSPTTATGTLSTYGTATFNVTGLVAGTTYHYGVALNGAAAVYLGSFKTAPATGFTGRILFGSCQQTGSDHVVFDQMRTEAADLLIHVGDENYGDVTSTAVVDHRAPRTTSGTAARYRALMASLAGHWTVDNHDGGGNGAHKDSPQMPAVRAAWADQVPRVAQPAQAVADDAQYHTFTWGPNIRVIVLDPRTRRDDEAAGASSSRSMLGATQLQWFKDTLLASTARVNLVGYAGIWHQGSGTGRWGSYPEEFQALCQWMAATNHPSYPGQQVVDRVLMLGGDLHALAADRGTRRGSTLTSPNVPTLPPQAIGAAFHQGGSSSGLAFSEGTALPNETGRGQYGVLDIVDSPGVTTVSYRGMRDDGTQRLAMSNLTWVDPATAVTGTVTGASSLTAVSVEREVTAGTVAGASTVAAGVVPRLAVAGTVTAASGVTAAVAERELVAAALSAASTVSADAYAFGGTPAVAGTLAGASTLSAVAAASGGAAAVTGALTGTSAVTASVVHRAVAGGTLTAAGTVSAATVGRETTTGILQGAAAMTATVLEREQAAASLVAAGGFTATAVTALAADLSATAATAANVVERETVAADLSGTASVTADAYASGGSPAVVGNVAAASTVSATAAAYGGAVPVTANLTGTSTVTGTSVQRAVTAGVVTADSAVTGASLARIPTLGELAALASQSATVTTRLAVTGSVTGTAVFTAVGATPNDGRRAATPLLRVTVPAGTVTTTTPAATLTLEDA